MSRIKLAALSGAVLLSTLSTPAPALAQPPLTVAQGDEVYVQKGTGPDGQIMVSSCRIGFMQADGRGLTAAHCGAPGAAVFAPDHPGVQLGTLAVPEAYQVVEQPEGGQWAANDYAYIDFLPGVVSGGNPITGDVRADRAQLNVGDEVCLASQDGPSCGPMVGIREEELFFSASAREGDSGGAVYSPTLGFLGVMSVGGIKAKDPVTEEELPILIASMGETGTSVVTPDEATTILMNYLKHKHGDNYTFSTPGAPEEKQPVEISFAPPADPAPTPEEDVALPAPRSMVSPAIAAAFGAVLLVMVCAAVIVVRRRNATVGDYEEPDSAVS